MFQRDIKRELVEVLAHFPVVTIVGPRQSGKTTLLRSSFPNMPYFNLEAPDTRELILADPRGFFTGVPEGCILDEIQRAPVLLSYIQEIVDKAQRMGMFILTGSQQMELHSAIGQSLAGRTALLDLYPLSITELQQGGISLPLDQQLLHGFYPAIYQRRLNPTVAYRNYVRTYIERDVRSLINVKDLTTFQRFIQLTVGRIGGVINFESLGNDVGVTANTIKNWLSILEASFLVRRLQPYFENFGKRLIKSPKLFFTDVGLCCYLLGIETPIQLSRDRLRGGLFENLVLMELLKTEYNAGHEPQLYFFRDAHGNEVDIIIKYGQYLIPVEIKSTATFDGALLKGIKYFQALVGERAPFGFLVYAGKEACQLQSIHLLNYRHASDIFTMIAAA